MSARESNPDACPLFADMTLDERRQLLMLLEEDSYPPGETIIREGRATQLLWIIVRGQCEVVKDRQNQSPEQLAILEPGSVFGEMSFFHPAPHSASVRSLTDVDVMRLSRDRYEHICQASPAAALKIAINTAGVLAQRLRRMDGWTRQLIEQTDVADHKEEWQEFRARLYADWQF